MPKKKPSTVKVRIVREDGQCKVKPSMITVQPGQTVEFHKKVDATVYVQVSEIGQTFKIKRSESDGSLTVPKKTRMGIYPYAIFCYEKKAFCTGSSMPIIIVPRC